MRGRLVRSIGVAVVLGVAFAAAAPLRAQFVKFPTPGVPRTADGKANLAAPAPRTPETQQLSSVRAGTLLFNQHTAPPAVSVG